MEGPRAVGKEDMLSLRELTDLVMREGLVDQFPHLFGDYNHANVRVCLDGGRCVSHVGMIERHASLLGCLVQVCCVGGVCTHPDYRMRGLASACFDDALAKARADGIDVMIVSGDRSLYRMRGCVHVGNDRVFTIARDAVPSSLADLSSRVTVDPMAGDELDEVMECYRSEPVRYLRPPSDYHLAISGGWVMNRPSDFLVIREGGAFRGYVIARGPEPDGSASLAEFAGERRSVLAALPHVLRRYDLASVGLHVMGYDRLLLSLCEQAGLAGRARSTPGTVTLVNFPQLMERMRPRYEELVGERTASRLSFRQRGTQLVFALDGDELALEQPAATQMLFGAPEGGPAPAAPLPQGALGEALRQILPLPTLWYGLNYV